MDGSATTDDPIALFEAWLAEHMPPDLTKFQKLLISARYWLLGMAEQL